MRGVRKLVTLLSIALVVSVGSFAIQARHAAPAHAYGTCYGSSCKNLDPTNTYGPDGNRCFNKAYVQETKTTSVGSVEDIWSANCNANYTVVNSVSGGGQVEMVEMELCPSGNVSNNTCASGGSYYSDTLSGFSCDSPIYVCNNAVIGGGTSHWYTNMVDGNYKVQSIGCFAETLWCDDVMTGFH